MLSHRRDYLKQSEKSYHFLNPKWSSYNVPLKALQKSTGIPFSQRNLDTSFMHNFFKAEPSMSTSLGSTRGKKMTAAARVWKVASRVPSHDKKHWIACVRMLRIHVPRKLDKESCNGLKVCRKEVPSVLLSSAIHANRIEPPSRCPFQWSPLQCCLWNWWMLKHILHILSFLLPHL